MRARGILASLEHGLTLEFLGVAAAHTHQMVMVAVVVITGQLEAAATFGKLQLPQQLH